MTPNEYQNQANASAPIKYPSMAAEVLELPIKHLMHGILGINSEAGELTDTFKKYIIYRTPLDFENIKEECGDILWYIALTLSSCGYTMEQTMQDNIDKLKIRYPSKFTEKDALERKDKQ